MSVEERKRLGAGTPAPIVPKGKYAVAHINDIRGGFQIVDNEAELLILPKWLREVGMEVYVIGSACKYRLINEPDTDDTVLQDWQRLYDGLSPSDKNGLLSKEEWNTAYVELTQSIANTYATKYDLEHNYMTAIQLMSSFQTIAGMADYVTNEQLQIIATALSRVVSRVIPPQVIRVAKGTALDDLNLPTSLTVVFSDGTHYMAPVNWITTTYEPNVEGYQIMDGSLVLPAYCIGLEDIPQMSRCACYIQVLPDNTIVEPVVVNDVSGFEPLTPIEVAHGTSINNITLPSTVSAETVTPDGVVEYVPAAVTWDTENLGVIYNAVTISGTITTTDTLSNILGLRPTVCIKVSEPRPDCTYQFASKVILKAGQATVSDHLRINSIDADMLYGVGGDVRQRMAEIRFVGILDENGNNLTPEIQEAFPRGIRMPVKTSSDTDVRQFRDRLTELNSTVGFDLSYEVPMGRVEIDDETHRLLFSNAVAHDLWLVLYLSADTNLPYPDIT